MTADYHRLPRMFAALTPAQRRWAVATMSEEAAEASAAAWRVNWAHRGQRAPEPPWRTWVIQAGRGFGKTRAGAEWIAGEVRSGCAVAIALIGATADEARELMVEGESGLLAVAAPLIEHWWPSRKLLVLSGGIEARLFSGASPDALRGFQHSHAWCDELAKWEKPQETWDMLQLGLRVGTLPRAIVTTTPQHGAVLSRIIATRGTVVTRGRTRGNPHTSSAFKDAAEGMYAGTRLGAQELDGELLSDMPGALWTEALLERCRVGSRQPGAASDPSLPVPRVLLPRFTQTLIGVDPPAGAGTCGIIVCAREAGGTMHVLADESVTGLSPEGWGAAVGQAAARHGATIAVAEINQGGRMVRAVLGAAAPALRVKSERAHLSKAERAAPVAQAFEKGRVMLHGRFPELEAQLCGMIARGDYEGPGNSPDRADAMVWALAELMKPERALPRIRVP